jgi:hypothetical protein
MSPMSPDDLSPAQRLELLRREEAERERKTHDRMNALLRAEHRTARAERDGLTSPGDLLPTRAMVEAKRAELKSSGLPHGYRPLAAALHVSVGVVRTPGHPHPGGGR